VACGKLQQVSTNTTAQYSKLAPPALKEGLHFIETFDLEQYIGGRRLNLFCFKTIVKMTLMKAHKILTVFFLWEQSV
jgi:hypothetical protein